MGVIETAKSYIGKVKYVFGSTDIDSGSGDCSAFTQHVFSKNGIEIGRNTNAQWQEGTLVNKEDLKGGELIFFSNTYDSNYIDNVSHVGISLGGTQFIHLSSSGVHISDFSHGYWSEHYLGAKNVGAGSEGANSSDSSETNSEGSKTSKNNSIGLEWWGDIVKVVIMILLILTSFIMLGLGVKNTVLK